MTAVDGRTCFIRVAGSNFISCLLLQHIWQFVSCFLDARTSHLLLLIICRFLDQHLSLVKTR